MPRITRPQVYRVVREMLPRERLGPEELLRLLEAEQLRNERASRSHAKRRAAPPGILGHPSLNCRCNTSGARNLAGNPDSPQAVVFLTSIIDETVGVATSYMHY